LILPCKVKKQALVHYFILQAGAVKYFLPHPSYRPLATNLSFHELNGLGLRFEKQVSFSGLCPFKKAKPGSKPKIIV